MPPDTDSRSEDAPRGHAVTLEVLCHAGYRGEQTPRRLIIDGREIEVADVLAQWHEPEARGFRLRGADGVVYELRQDVVSGAWWLD